MDRQTIDDAQSHRLVRRPGKCLRDTLRKHFGDFQDGANVGVCAQNRIGRHGFPELVITDQTRPIVRHLILQNSLDLVAECHKSTALLGEDQALERSNVIRMDREEPDILVHAFIHGAIEFRERRQVRANFVLLVCGLLEKSLSDHETHVLPGQQDLGEAILHTPQTRPPPAAHRDWDGPRRMPPSSPRKQPCC